MAWQDFIKSVRKTEKKKKDPQKKFTEMFMCNFNPDQMKFIEEHSEIYGSKANVIRNGLNLLIKQHQRNVDPKSDNNK